VSRKREKKILRTSRKGQPVSHAIPPHNHPEGSSFTLCLNRRETLYHITFATGKRENRRLPLITQGDAFTNACPIEPIEQTIRRVIRGSRLFSLISA